MIVQWIRKLNYLWLQSRPCSEYHAPHPQETLQEYRARSGCGLGEANRCIEWWKIERGGGFPISGTETTR